MNVKIIGEKIKDKNIWRYILNGLKIFFINTLRTFKSIVMAYFLPIINIGLVLIISAENKDSYYTIINIILATNVCFVMGITNYFKINTKYNGVNNFLRTITLVTCAVAFGISTYEIEMNNINRLPIYIYGVIAFASFMIVILLCWLSEKENTDSESVVSNAQKILNQKRMTTVQRDGLEFKI